MNTLSFFAIGFEKYICQTMQDVEPRIKNAAVLAEARAFRAQEGIHSNAHRRHVKALIKQYPALQEALDKTIASYDALYAAKPLEYHLAYDRGLESIFTPSFKLPARQSAGLVQTAGDARLPRCCCGTSARRSSTAVPALEIYNHVVGKYLFRVGNFKNFMGHVKEVTNMLAAEFKKHVPGITDEMLDPKATSSVKLPRKDKFLASYGILMSQMPWHHPMNQSLPAYFQEWSDQYDRGEDMTQTYGVRWEKELVTA